MAEVSSPIKVKQETTLASSEVDTQSVNNLTSEPSESTFATGDATMIPSSNTLPSFANYAQQGFPLFLLLIINLIYSHTAYIALFIALVLVFDWSNDIILRQAYLLDKRSISTLTLIISFVSLNTVLIFPIIETLWVFHISDFSNWMHSPSAFSSVLFDVVLMDFVIKFFTLSFKCLLIVPPSSLIPTPKRNGLFVFLEAFSQLLRCLMPVLEWIKYITTSPSCISLIICWFVAALYCAIKICSLESKLSLLKTGWNLWRQPEVIGRALVLDEEVSALKPCPICHEQCKNPVSLSCSHVFCFSCCHMWFCWDKHCPVCSSSAVMSFVLGETQRVPPLLQISSNKSSWKRGSTDYMVQFF